MADRDSQSGELELIVDPGEKARTEAANALRQTRAAMALLPAWIGSDRPTLRPSLFQNLHGILMQRISPYPGVFRPGPMSISKSEHKPPPPFEVPRLVEELCDYVNENWHGRSALHLASYVLWRTNWIHPFADGNGRTARIVSYLVLCAHTRTELPGTPTIPEQIAIDKKPYYEALEHADSHFRRGSVDVSSLEALLEAYLAQQLLGFFETAGGRANDLGADVKAEVSHAIAAAQSAGYADRQARPLLPSLKRRNFWLDELEARPVLYGGLLTIAVAVIGWLFFR